MLQKGGKHHVHLFLTDVGPKARNAKTSFNTP